MNQLIHPFDSERFGRLAEMLMDASRGWMMTREALIPVTRSLMSQYGDRDYRSAAEVDAMVDRLLAIADDWYGIPTLAKRVEAVICGLPLPAPPTFADSYRRAPEGLGGLLA